MAQPIRRTVYALWFRGRLRAEERPQQESPEPGSEEPQVALPLAAE